MCVVPGICVRYLMIVAICCFKRTGSRDDESAERKDIGI